MLWLMLHTDNLERDTQPLDVDPRGAAMTWGPWVLVAALWWASGMTAVSALYRRGHDGWGWLVAGALLGPIAFLLLLDQARFVEPEATSVQLAAGRPAPGSLDVLVVVPSDGPASPALAAVTRLVAAALGRVTLVAGVPFERTGPDRWESPEARATLALERSRQAFDAYQPDLVLLPGRLPDNVVTHARDHDYDLIVVARDGHSSWFWTHLVRRAAHHEGVSVLVADRSLAFAAERPQRKR